ncbi:MAG TPA: hypothetical protein VN380_22370 [Thermoanaerobaculia bacterium]|jgi:hypothetical protein|nr:hypothetical protein [Thermoanaerobaculia bacterium]
MRQVAGALVAVVLLLLVALPAVAVDLGRAEGILTVDGTKIPLNYAYAIGKQKNQLTDRKEMTRVILTDKELPADAKLADLDDNLPGDLNGVIISIDKQGHVGHVAIQHPTGNYDGGYFEGLPDYEFKPHKGDSGTFGGSVSSLRVKTNTMTFSYDATFVAALR